MYIKHLKTLTLASLVTLAGMTENSYGACHTYDFYNQPSSTKLPAEWAIVKCRVHNTIGMAKIVDNYNYIDRANATADEAKKECQAEADERNKKYKDQDMVTTYQNCEVIKRSTDTTK